MARGKFFDSMGSERTLLYDLSCIISANRWRYVAWEMLLATQACTALGPLCPLRRHRRPVSSFLRLCRPAEMPAEHFAWRPYTDVPHSSAALAFLAMSLCFVGSLWKRQRAFVAVACTIGAYQMMRTSATYADINIRAIAIPPLVFHTLGTLGRGPMPLSQAIHAYFDPRGKRAPTTETRPRRHFLVRKATSIIVLYFVQDAVIYAYSLTPFLMTCGAIPFSAQTPSQQLLLIVAPVVGTYTPLRLAHDSLAFICVALRISEPAAWPDLFGPLTGVTSVRRFWGSTWHVHAFRSSLSHCAHFEAQQFHRKVHCSSSTT
jgi:hypothetical protein